MRKLIKYAILLPSIIIPLALIALLVSPWNPFPIMKTHGKFIIPIILIIVTVFEAFVIARLFQDQFDTWISWDILKKIRIQIIQMDAAIITGLFILLGFALQSSLRALSSHLFSALDVKAWIIGITAPTTFPFVASIMLLAFFGFAPSRYYPMRTRYTATGDKVYYLVPHWAAKMGLLLMIFGFVWIMGDLVAILFLLA